MDRIDLAPEEIEELAEVLWLVVAKHMRTYAGRKSLLPWSDVHPAYQPMYRKAAIAVLRKRQEQAMRRLYRDVIEVKDHSYSALAWIEDGQVRCCSSLCREDDICEHRDLHKCREVLVYDEEVLCRG